MAQNGWVLKAAYDGDIGVLMWAKDSGVDFNTPVGAIMLNRHFTSFAFLGRVTPYLCAVLGNQLQAMQFIESTEGFDIAAPFGRAGDYNVFTYINRLNDKDRSKLPSPLILHHIQAQIKPEHNHLVNRSPIDDKKNKTLTAKAATGAGLGGAAIGAVIGGAGLAMLGPFGISAGAALGAAFGAAVGGIPGVAVGAGAASAIKYDKDKAVFHAKHNVDEYDAALVHQSTQENSAVFTRVNGENAEAQTENQQQQQAQTQETDESVREARAETAQARQAEQRLKVDNKALQEEVNQKTESVARLTKERDAQRAARRELKTANAKLKKANAEKNEVIRKKQAKLEQKDIDLRQKEEKITKLEKELYLSKLRIGHAGTAAPTHSINLEQPFRNQRVSDLQSAGMYAVTGHQAKQGVSSTPRHSVLRGKEPKPRANRA